MADQAVWPEELGRDIERSGPIPLYYQLASRLEAAIRSGEIPPGALLDNEISIGKRLTLSRPTVRRAIQELVDKGLLVRRRGIGTRVVQGRLARQVELTSLYEDLDSTHLQPATRVLACDVREADDDVARRLGVAAGSPVLYIRRLRTAKSAPLAVMENYLPEIFTDITPEQLESDALYQIIRARGVQIRLARQQIGARRARGDEARLLEIDDGGPVLTLERIAYDEEGKAVESGAHCYRPEEYVFETTVVAK